MQDEPRSGNQAEGRESPRRARQPDKNPDSRLSCRALTPADRLLILDIWDRAGVGGPQFAELLGISSASLYQWRRRFKRLGPAGLEDQPRGAKKGQSKLAEATQRAILMMKRSHEDWGSERIHQMLLRSVGYAASAGAIQRLLISNGYEVQSVPTRPHPPKQVRRFERARANQMWQTDLFTFLLKRENRRLYMVAFMDDYSRFIVSHAVSASSSGTFVRDAVETGIANFGPPEEILTDNGPQYHSWRGKSAFRKLLEKRGIKHLLARPRRPQTLGKTERFWQTLWKECLEAAVIQSVEDARTRIGHFVDYYNFHRTHQGIEGLIPADRFFGAEKQVRETIESRVKQNALDLARFGTPRQNVYLSGQVGSESISLHGEGGRIVLTTDGGSREEVDMSATGRREEMEKPVEEEGDAEE